MKNENTWTQGREYETLGSIGEKRGGTVGGGSWRRIAWGEMPNVGEGEEGSKTHCHVCTYANVLHDPHMYPKLKCNKKKYIYIYKRRKEKGISCKWTPKASRGCYSYIRQNRL